MTMTYSNILGQRTRKANIDFGLAERINREAAEEARRKRLEEKQRPVVEKQESSRSSGRTLRLNAPLFKMVPGNDLDIRELTDYLENREKPSEPNLVLASMADYYALFKKAKDDNDFLRAIRIALSFNCPFISSTIVEYHVTPLETLPVNNWFSIDSGPHRVIHHFGSNDNNIVQEREHYLVPSEIRHLPGMLYGKWGEAFIKGLFGTNDDANTIMDTLESAFDIDRKDFLVAMMPFQQSYNHVDKLKYETTLYKMRSIVNSKQQVIISATNLLESTKGAGWGVYYE
ncbi:hypothetical protein JXB28_06490 [Candidatus Woesearchaeota archaeon]|nr:hypothetical protein [Candidatus Woesearchaeota archaeon]